MAGVCELNKSEDCEVGSDVLFRLYTTWSVLLAPLTPCRISESIS